MSDDVLAKVRDYYGRVLQSSRDLQTNACCTAEAMPRHLLPILREIHPEVLDRFYGCGSPIPPALDGATVLDLGCGSGRDCYLLSRLVGASGRVIGVDMTEAQLAVARRHQAYHADRFGYANVEFVHGCIEDLSAIADASVDLVVSNCVLNLSPDKPRVFAEIFRVLKTGGELYFSDVFADRRIAAPLREDPVLLGECLGGAIYVEDFRRVLAQAGCADARRVSSAPLTLNNPDIEARIGMVRFTSDAVRAFKLDLEDRCEDYGQVATYLGTVPGHPHHFVLDDHHVFETGRPIRVCGNSADMVSRTRYAAHFRVAGDQSAHYGLFDCGPVAAATTPGSGAACC